MDRLDLSSLNVNTHHTNGATSPLDQAATAESRTKCSKPNGASQWSYRESNLENTPDQIMEFKNKFRTSTDSEESNIPFSRHDSSISDSTSPEQLGDYKTRRKLEDGSVSPSELSEACLSLDNCIQRDRLGNGITVSASEGEDEGGFYGDSDEDIVDVVYAFADYTLGEDDEHQVGLYVPCLSWSKYAYRCPFS